MRLEVSPLAADDLNQAIAYYDNQRSGLGDVLRVEVYAAADRILQNPAQFRIVEAEIRRCLVRRFPYSVLYRIVGDDLVRILEPEESSYQAP